MYQCNTDSRELIAAFPQLLRTGLSSERLCCSLTTTGRGVTERWLSPTPPSCSSNLSSLFAVHSMTSLHPAGTHTSRLHIALTFNKVS